MTNEMISRTKTIHVAIFFDPTGGFSTIAFLSKEEALECRGYGDYVTSHVVHVDVPIHEYDKWQKNGKPMATEEIYKC